MSFDITDGDRRAWQSRNLTTLTELVRIGEKRQLSPLFWTLPDAGTITGKTGVGDDHREVFEEWHAALLADSRITTRGLGLRGDYPYRREHTDEGHVRLIAGFDFAAPSGTAQVCLRAEFEESA